jgi:AraC-like DNA-binding protein
MTFYNEQITKISRGLYPKDDLTRHVIQAKHFIDNRFADNINLDHIAEKAFLSKFHFIRLFKSYYGRTPYQYLTSVRIENAKQLLKTGKTISGVCFAVGFDSVTSFTGLFKKMTGSTPAVYKKRNDKKQFSRSIIANQL